MDFAAGLERDGPVAVKFQLVCPPVAIVREAVRAQKQHRINEMARHFRSHQASLADPSNQATKGEPPWRILRRVLEAMLTPTPHVWDFAPRSASSTCLERCQQGTR